jgi:hypothetical protein
MYKVWYVNHGYYGNNDMPLASVAAALDYAKSKCFQASIVRVEDNRVMASWCPLNGTRHY